MSSAVCSHQQLSTLFIAHRDDVLRYLYQRVSCPHVAQDLAQETYLRLMAVTQMPHAENLTGYLFRIAERLAIDFVRYDQRHAQRSEVLSDGLLCPVPQPDQWLELQQQCQLLIDAVASLPTLTRSILLLRKVDELTYQDIAARLQVSEKTVQRQLVKAMMHLHLRLQRADCAYGAD